MIKNVQISGSEYYIKGYNTFSLGTNCLQGDIKKNRFQNSLCNL